jgi:hypothetical protein
MQKEKVIITPHPDKVLIKITHAEWHALFSVWIKRSDGSKVQLFTDVEEEEGYEGRFKQNLSVGNIVAVGSNVKGPLKGDIAIIDYMVTGTHDSVIGFHNGAKIISIDAFSTYHDSDSPEQLGGRRAWIKGDFNVVSKLLGLVREKKLIALRPYIFLTYEPTQRLSVSESGLAMETNDKLLTREVLAAHPDTGYSDGEKVLIGDDDLFTRVIDGKQISVVMERDIIAKV